MKEKKKVDYGSDTDSLLSLVTERGRDPFSGERGSMLYDLEAEEIDLKKMEANA